MNILIEQLEKSLELDVPVLSLMGTVTLIDICAAINSPNGKTSGQKFINWYENYIGIHFFMFDGHECYALRCKLLHQGKADYSHDKMNSFFKNGKILFNVSKGTIHNCNANGYYYLDPKEFIRIVINGVKKMGRED